MSEITRGVIGMPFDMAMGSELSRRQFHSIAQGLLAENDRLTEEYDKAWRHDLNDKNNVQALTAEIARLNTELEGYKQGAKAEADAGDEARAEVRKLKAELERMTKIAYAAHGAFRMETLAERDKLKAENAHLLAQVQSMIDQTTPLEPDPGNPMWSRRVTIDGLVAERDALRQALREVMTQVDGNIRETVRDCVNGRDDVQDIYGYCDSIEAIVGEALLSE